MAKDAETKKVEARRDFLKLASLGTLVGGAVLASPGKSEAAVSDMETGNGYRETGHVKTFYNLARF